MLTKVVQSPYTGLVVMVAGLALEAFSSGWLLFAVGAAWTMGAQRVENHALKLRLQPKLRLVFKPGSPCERDKPLYDSDGRLTGGILKIFAIGVTNSGESVSDVSVKLLKIEPPESPERWGLSLRVLDSDGASMATIHRSPLTPLVYYELLTQGIRPDGRREFTALRFADTKLFDRVRLPDHDRYFITLAISGAGAEGPTRFVLLQNEHGYYEMRGALYP